MTGFLLPKQEVSPHNSRALSDCSAAPSSFSASSWSSSHSYTPPHSQSTRTTFLSNLAVKSPGPNLHTTPLHQFSSHPTKSAQSSAKYSWHHSKTGNPYHPPLIDQSNTPIRRPCTPSHTSKAPRPERTDWSTSKVPRFKGLQYSTKKTKRRTVLPWGNPQDKVEYYPCVIQRTVRFHMQDDRNSCIGGNHVFHNKHDAHKIEDLEFKIKSMRENVWKTLRPRGTALLNFPKTLHEKLAEKQQVERDRRRRGRVHAKGKR